MLAFIINNRPLKRLSDAPNGLQGSRHSFHFSARVFYGFKGAQARRPWKMNPFMPSYMTIEIDIPYINPQPSPLASSSNHNNPPPSSLRSSLGPWSSLRAWLTFPPSALDAYLASPLELGALQLSAKLQASETSVGTSVPTKYKTISNLFSSFMWWMWIEYLSWAFLATLW